MGETVRSLGGGWGQYEEDGIESMESETPSRYYSVDHDVRI